MDSSRLEYLSECRRLERALLQAVSEGQEHLADVCLDSLERQRETHRKKNSLRDRQNDSIAMNVLLCRTAEQAGPGLLHCEELFQRIARQIEKLTSEEGCRRLQHRMVRSYCRLARGAEQTKGSPLIRQAVAAIDSDLKADLTLKALAKRLSVNASYLSALFRRETGVPLTEYVNRRRIAYAQRLLGDTELPVNVIAHRCGFADVCYFSRCFKRHTGQTPGLFRKSSRPGR